MVVGARKLGHISCGNGVITSPITAAIRVGGGGGCRGLETKPIGMQMGAHEWALKNDLRHITHTKICKSLELKPHV